MTTSAPKLTSVSIGLLSVLQRRFDELQEHLATHDNTLVMLNSSPLRALIDKNRALLLGVQTDPALFPEKREELMLIATSVRRHLIAHSGDTSVPEELTAEVDALWQALITLTALEGN